MKKLGTVLVIFALLMMVSCVENTNVYHHHSFSPPSVDAIAVFPVLDARRVVYVDGRFPEKSMNIQQIISKSLAKKGYNSLLFSDVTTVEDLRPSMIPFMGPDQIRKIGSSDTKWILVPTVVELGTSGIDGPKSCEIVCYLYDKSSGMLIWEGSAMTNDLEKSCDTLMGAFPSRK
jgi:hypothetical protein